MGTTSSQRSALVTPTRRRVLQAGGGSLAALALGACNSTGPRTPGGSESATAGGEGAVEQPSFIKFDGVTPDLAGDGQHVPDGFVSFPQEPVKATSTVPGDGSTVTITCQAFGQVPPTMDKNAYWQELNARLGVTMDFHSIGAEYETKIATQLAGGDLTDIVQIPTWSMKRLPELLAARFADLTDHLAGDAIADFPLLANNPSYIWPASTYNGRIMGIRRSLFTYGSFLLGNRGVLDDLGLAVDSVTDSTTFAELCVAATDATANRWALMNPVNTVRFVAEMLGSPAIWREEGGQFIHGREDERYRQALAFVKESLWDKGCYHPDSLGLTGGDEIKQFVAGRAVLDFRGGNQWDTLTRNSGVDVTAVAPVDFDGNGMGVKELGDGVYSLTAFNAELDPERIAMLLGVANWLAAPFGTEEFLFRSYGVEGEHHSRTPDGTIQMEAKGSEEIQLPNAYVASSPTSIYVPGHPDVTKEFHAFVSKVAAEGAGAQSAAVGLWSEAADAKNAEIEAALTDTIKGVFRDQYTLADFDDAMDAWRADGGDQIRSEYEQGFADRANA